MRYLSFTHLIVFPTVVAVTAIGGTNVFLSLRGETTVAAHGLWPKGVGSAPQISSSSSTVLKQDSISQWETPRSGWLYVLDVAEGVQVDLRKPQIVLVDPRDSSIRGRVPLRSTPEMALSPDGSRLYVVHGTELAIIDTAAGKFVQRLPLSNRRGYMGAPDLPGLLVSADGRRLHIAKHYGNNPVNLLSTVQTFDTESGTFLPNEAEVRCQSQLLLPSATEQALVVLCISANDVRFVRLAPSGAMATMTGLSLPRGSVVSPELVTRYGLRHALGYFNLRTGGVSVDRRTIAVVMGDGYIFEIGEATQNITRVLGKVDLGGRLVPPSPIGRSPDGSRLYVVTHGLTAADAHKSEVFVIDTNTGQHLATITTSLPIHTLAISKDGSYLYAPTFDSLKKPTFEARIIVIDAYNYREIGAIGGVGWRPAHVLVAP